MAGHRSGTSLALVFRSVVPVTVGSVLIWGLAGVPFDAYGVALVIIGGFLAIVAPYAVGWTRGTVALLVLVAGLRWVDHLLAAEPVALRVVVAVGLVGVVAAVTWISLRFGEVNRPADSRTGQDKSDGTWPYPYA